ncbi:TlpA family protein disulfide reductase [Limibaculum sp. FT325]|uniref:TlpA disulfide reductase family protein n=1 Tax=Thermohalobaculum sediminis TaxID=2939436 RepID=UPI0020BEB9BB|nr:TlpA disulfide reductase family protein [Limibaculum sediminis]MCL5778465.1 TlpA family protein disulfide reductase [Limibaculum sediminis]
MTFPRPFALGIAAILYGAMALSANPSDAGAIGPSDRAALEAMRAGDMRKLVFHDTPRAQMTESFQDGAGRTVGLADFSGKVVVLNIWATWCPPCRAEMPSLDRLAAKVKGDGIEIVALSTDRGGAAKVRGFFDEIGVKNLAIYADPSNRLARQAAVMGLPVTLILDREGREIARLTGDAHWDGADALAILRRISVMTRGAHTQGARLDTGTALADADPAGRLR